MASTIDHPVTQAQTVQAIYNVFFASLMLMLILSSAIILYGGLYCSAEAEFLLTTPVRPERIVLHKFQEAIVFSSWGFLLLGSPMLVAYGLQVDAPWYYFALLLPFMAAFVYIPGGLGAILCMLFVHHLARMRRQLFAGRARRGRGGLAPVVGWSLLGETEGNLLTAALVSGNARPAAVQRAPAAAQLVAQLGLARSGPQRRRPAGQCALGRKPAVSVAADLQRAVFAGAGRGVGGPDLSHQLQRAAHRACPAAAPARISGSTRPVMRFAPLLTPQMRLLIVKDLRLFRRDPVQWSQFIIFFGLLALYFANIRRFSYDVNYTAWVNMISFLNLAVVGLILSTFTTRFIFPMLSLEGRRFWILSMLPVRRESILWGKFLFAAVGSAAALLPADPAQRLHAASLAAGAGDSSVDLPAVVPGPVGHRRGAGGQDARPARRVALENRGRLRRHAEPGDQRHLHHR